MRSSNPVLKAVVVGLTVAVATVVAPPSTVAGAPRGAAAAPDHARSDRVQRVTLITGDRLTVVAGNKIAVERGPGRAGVPFVTRVIDGHRYAIPVDALPLLRDGRLDPRLFDVTTLLESGFDDRRGDVPLIVQYRAAGGNTLAVGRAAARSALAADGVKVTRELPAVRAMAVRAGTDARADLWRGLTGSASGVAARGLRPGVASIWLDGWRKPTLDVSVPQIGAPTAWARGFDGAGQTVAVLDTGIDVTHPDLADRITASSNFTEGEEDDRDLVGHGTHVASTIAGSGAGSGGRYTGVAPGARLLNGKVCVQFGCAESWILAGMQWAAESGASVVNMSLGGPDRPGLDLLEQAVGTLTEAHGTLFVVAAGNLGPGVNTVSSPGTAPEALTVGAVTKTEQLADFSGQGMTADDALKPDLTAPGVEIVAARGKDGFLGEPGELYMALDGTSMATPHAAGAAAILHQRHPDWTPARIKAALVGSAAPNPALAAHEQGAGRVDVARALDASIVVSPATVSFGRARWPHDDDEPIARTVTYTNLGSTEQTLNIALTATGPDGAAAPAGAFTVSPTTVTVPAGGEATVTVTADTRLGELDGFYGGRLTATGGGTVVQTAFSVNRETESYDVTFVHTDRYGAPAAAYSTVLLGLDNFAFYDLFEPDGTVTARLPKGRYMLSTVVVDESVDPLGFTFLIQPLLTVTGDQTVRLDARKGKPIKVTVPDRAVTPVLIDVAGILMSEEFFIETGFLLDRFANFYTAHVGPSHPDFLSRVNVTFANVGSDGDMSNSRRTYLLSWFVPDRFVTGFRRSVTRADLAAVRVDHLRHADGTGGGTAAFGEPADVSFGGWAVVLPFDLPFERLDFFGTEGGIRWTRFFEETVDAGGFPEPISFAAEWQRTMRAGSSTTERWNHAAFGPTLANPPFPDLWASRVGDTLIVVPPPFGDVVGREGYSVTQAERTIVTRDGTVISDEPFFGTALDVPPGAATYRVTARAERAAPFTLSTVVEAAWTFRSSHVDGEAPRRLPLSVVRFSPVVDRTNTALAGRTVLVPLTVVTQPDSGAGRVAALSVEVSYDDGSSWKRASVINVLGHRFVVLHHPAAAGYVSLRTRLEDTNRNTAEQTVIHAYRIAPRR
jgi:subtilisin family serine protease